MYDIVEHSKSYTLGQATGKITHSKRLLVMENMLRYVQCVSCVLLLGQAKQYLSTEGDWDTARALGEILCYVIFLRGLTDLYIAGVAIFSGGR